MANPNTEIDHEVVKRNVAQANESIQQMRGHINKALSQTQGTVGSGWAGSAAGTGLNTVTDMHAQGQKALNQLDDLQTAINQGSNTFTNQEEESRQSLGPQTNLL